MVKVSDQFIKLSKVSAIEGTKGIEEIKDTKTYTLKYVEPFKKIPVEIIPIFLVNSFVYS